MTPQARRLVDLALLAAGVLLLGFAYRPLLTLGTRYGTAQYEFEEWLMTPNDQAPLVIIVLAAWLAYRRWPRLRSLPAQRGPLPLAGLAFAFGLGSAAWAFHALADDLLAFSLMANGAGLLLLHRGLPGLRVMWVPLVLLLFCVPIPGPLLVTTLWELRVTTAEYTGWILYLLGSPAFVSGDQIVRATQTFQVIEGCSGLRSMETLTLLVILMIDLFDRRGWHAAVLLVAAPTTAFAMNGLRVLTLILNPHSEVVAIHSLQGIGILLAGLLVLYGLDTLIAKWRGERHQPSGPPAPATPSGAAPAVPRAVLATGALMAGVALATPSGDYPTLRVIDLKRVVAEIMGEDARFEDLPDSSYFRGRVRFRRSVNRRYPRGISGIDVFVGTGDRRDRRTSILSPLTRVPSSGWRVRESRTLEIDGQPVVASLIEKGLQRRLSYHWYEGRHSLAAESLASLLAIDRSPYGSREPIAVVRLSANAPSLDEGLSGRSGPRLEAAFRELTRALQERMAQEEPS